MWQRWVWMVVVIFFAGMIATPVQAAELVHPITLYQEAVKVENMIRQSESPNKVLPALDVLSEMYTRLDTESIHQRIEGVQAVSAELISLKQMYAAVKGPEQIVAQFRIKRVVMAFDSLAYPTSPAWLPIVRSMENQLDKSIEAVAKQDQKSAKTIFAGLRSERDQVWLALQLHGDPSELNLQLSAHRFIETQLGLEQVSDKQGTLDSLGAYKASLGKIVTGMPTVKEPPLLPVLHLTLDPVTYGTTGAALLAFFGWRYYRKNKN
jgi:hypothetical protein